MKHRIIHVLIGAICLAIIFLVPPNMVTTFLGAFFGWCFGLSTALLDHQKFDRMLRRADLEK